ncbi:hypothetical protein DL768_007334 [Monosporascus sp. mg162]|nr:hypothetical protein DL768_007334 [Monosporascus sp. mg162]
MRSKDWEPSDLGKRGCVYNDPMAEFETGLLGLGVGGGISNRMRFKHVVYGTKRDEDDINAQTPGERGFGVHIWNALSSVLRGTTYCTQLIQSIIILPYVRYCLRMAEKTTQHE